MAIWGYTLFSILVLSLFASFIKSQQTETKEFVLTLDHTNFTETVSKHVFIVVNFYASWCEHSKNLAPEFEKAASELSSHVPPVVLAKFDASTEANRELGNKYWIEYFPTIKILKYGGKLPERYNGPVKAENIIFDLKRRIKEPISSLEIKSVDDAAELITDEEFVAVGIFPKLWGSEFSSFLLFAYILGSQYKFVHTLDARLLPRGDSSVTGPVLRLFKPLDKLCLDSKDFDLDALRKFVEESSCVPLITVFDKNPKNEPHIVKFFESPYTKVMLFMNFTGEAAKSLKSKYHEVATSNKGQGLSFLVGDVESSQGAFQYFRLEKSQVPLIIIQTVDDKKYLKTNVEVDQIESWVEDFKDGKVAPYKKSQPIPTENNEPVKVVVSASLDDMVFNSGKNVLLKLYVTWCGSCQKLVPILDEVAVSYLSEPSVVIAKLDVGKNDIPTETFDVKGFPTIYFRSASGNIVVYEGDMRKEDIISFIDKNKDTAGEPKEEKISEEVKDEL